MTNLIKHIEQRIEELSLSGFDYGHRGDKGQMNLCNILIDELKSILIYIKEHESKSND